MDYLEALTVSFIAFPSWLSKTHLWFLIWFRRRLGWVAGVDRITGSRRGRDGRFGPLGQMEPGRTVGEGFP